VTGVGLPTLPTPLADRFMGHGDTAFAQEILPVAGVQSEARGEPDAMPDEVTGTAVMLITLGPGWSGHVWLPILVCNGSQRRHRQCNYVMAQAGGQHVDRRATVERYDKRLPMSCKSTPRSVEPRPPQ
jgi:hypothetical protein